jgi:HlyD family secretion protein
VRGSWVVVVAVVLLSVGCTEEGPPPMVGTLERDRYQLVAEAAEPIVEVAALEGQCVAAGDAVVALDPRRTAAEVAGAREELRRATARLAELERGPRHERIAAARAELAGAAETVEVAAREHERFATLEQSGVVAAHELDVRQRQLAAARADRDAAAAWLEELVRGTTAEELEQARAAAASAAARLEELEVTLERLTARSPRAACIEALPYELGERPPLGATVAVLLADGPPWARIYVPEPLRARVVPGTELVLTVDGVAGRLAGRVRTVAREPVFTPHFALTERDRSRLTYLAEVDLADAAARDLPAGLPVEATLGPAPEAGAEPSAGPPSAAVDAARGSRPAESPRRAAFGAALKVGAASNGLSGSGARERL